MFLSEWRTKLCRGADNSLARPGRKQANVSVRMAWISFGALPSRGEKNLMTARVSMLLISRASLTCFQACFLPGRAKDLSPPPYLVFETACKIYSLCSSADSSKVDQSLHSLTTKSDVRPLRLPRQSWASELVWHWAELWDTNHYR